MKAGTTSVETAITVTLDAKCLDPLTLLAGQFADFSYYLGTGPVRLNWVDEKLARFKEGCGPAKITSMFTKGEDGKRQALDKELFTVDYEKRFLMLNSSNT